MTKLLSCHYNMDTNRVRPGSRMAPLLPSTASPWRTSTATLRHSGQNWTGCSIISPLEYAQMVLRGEMERYLSLGV